MCGAQEDFIALWSVASQLGSDWDKFHGEQKPKTELKKDWKFCFICDDVGDIIQYIL